MYNYKHTKINRILASFLVICMLAMATFPYGNIAWAITEEKPIIQQENIDNKILSTETTPPPTESETTTPPTTEPETPPPTEPEITPPPTEPAEPETTTPPKEPTEPEITPPPTEPTEPETTMPPTEPTEPETTPPPTEPTEPEITPPPTESTEPETTTPPTEPTEPEITTPPTTPTEPEIIPATPLVSPMTSALPGAEYTITYLGVEGAIVNPANITVYTAETETFTLTRPIKQGFEFTGWTGTGLTELTLDVTIQKGSTGDREYTANWIIDVNPYIKETKFEIIKGNSIGYISIGDQIRVTFVGENLNKPGIKFFGKDFDLILANGGENNTWIVEKTLTEQDCIQLGNKIDLAISYYIYDNMENVDGTTSEVFLEPSYHEDIYIDNILPSKPKIGTISYGEIGTNVAKASITLEDNLKIDKLKVVKDGKESFIDINKNKNAIINYDFTSIGNYDFYAIDGSGKISEVSSVEITKGDKPYMKILQYPKRIYSQGDPFTLEGGIVKVGYTFDVCGEHCSCEKNPDGTCIEGSCKKNDYSCLEFNMKDMICDVPDTFTQIIGKNKVVDIVNPNFADLSVSYTIDVVEINSNLARFEEVTGLDKITVDVFTSLKNVKYTWSSTQGDPGKEVYRSKYVDNDNFTYNTTLVENGVEKPTDIGWFFDSSKNVYNCTKLISKNEMEAVSTIKVKNIPETTTGNVSFEWKTNSRNGDIFSVFLGGSDKPAMSPVSGISSKWNTFSGKCPVNANGEFEIKLSYKITGKSAATVEIPVSIRNLTFEGEKKWNDIGNTTGKEDVTNFDKYRVSLDNPLGPNNYLFIKGDYTDEKGTTSTVVIDSKKACKGNVILEGIEIHTVPNKTFYKKNDDNEINTYGGKITLIYNVGTEKIDMSEGVISVDNTGKGIFENTIDVNNPGIKEIKVAYGSYEAYFSVMVGYDEKDAKNIRNNRNEANEPALLNGMIPVKWYPKGGYWVTTTTYDADWYNYVENRQWANVMMRDGLVIQEVEDLSKYKNLELLAGKKVLSEGSSFVWIPRYTYEIMDTSGDFKPTNVVNIEWSNGIDDSNGISKGCKKHPAFTYGSNELTGFWMAKYEASEGEATIVSSKPGVIPYYKLEAVSGPVSLQDAYDMSVGMASNTEAKGYGVNFKDSVSHLTKQAEWGAVAMLAYNQKYGNIPYINNYMLGDAVLSTGYNGSDMSSPEDNRDVNSDINASKYLYEFTDKEQDIIFGSTTGNIYGIFDMSGGAYEYVASYVKKSDGIEHLVPDNTNDVDIVDLTTGDTLYQAISKHNGWGIFDITSNNIKDRRGKDFPLEKLTKWEGGTLISFHEDEIYVRDPARGDFREIIGRGGTANGNKRSGILALKIIAQDAINTSNMLYGFRPTILIIKEQPKEEVVIESISITNKNNPSSSWAKENDVVEVKVVANGALNISDFVFKKGNAKTEVIKGENGHKEWIFTYIVKSGDNGELGFEFTHEGNIKNQTTDNSKITMDTSADTPDINISEGDGKVDVNIIVPPGSNVDKITIVDKAGNKIEIPSNGGSIELDKDGNYIVETTDKAGNKTEVTIVVTPEQLNKVKPIITELNIQVYDKGLSKYEYFVQNNKQVKDSASILENTKVKFNVKFDKALTSTPILTISNNRQISFTKSEINNNQKWEAEFITDSRDAYDNFIFEVSGHIHNNNEGERINQGNYNFNIPYDGSFVDVEIGIPEKYQLIDNKWQLVDKIEKPEPEKIKLEYVVNFSDKTKGPSSKVIDNIDSDYGINLSKDDIEILNNVKADIEVSGGKNPNEKKIVFTNVDGTGQFNFTIKGATISKPIPKHVVAKDKYGHPNKQVTTSGNSSVWLTNDGTGNEFTITYEADGGQGAPDTQIKVRNVDIKLSTQIPTKEGATFSHWEGMGPGGVLVTYKPGDMYTVDASIRLKAIYITNKYNVIANPVPSSGGTTEGSGSYEYGATVTLTANSNSGYKFTGWRLVTGGITLENTTSKVLTFKMPMNDVEVEAVFERREYTVFVEIDPKGSGTVTGSGSYTYNQLVQLTATPNKGYKFIGWTNTSNNVELNSTDNVTEFRMPSENVYIKAQFAADSFTVITSVIPEGTGTVTGGGNYVLGSNVVLNAIPQDGYIFSGWEVISGGISLPNTPNTSFKMPANDVEVRAKFESNIYLVTGTSNPLEAGTISGLGGYDANIEVTLEAVPNLGYKFKNWEVVSGGVTLTDATNPVFKFTMPANNVEVKANFEVANYNVTAVIEPLNMGSVTGVGTYAYNADVKLTAVPIEGQQFECWEIITGGIEIIDPTNPILNFKMPAQNVELKAKFKPLPKKYKFTVKNPFVTRIENKLEGTPVNARATSNENYQFSSWIASGLVLTPEQQTSSTITFTMPGNEVTLIAIYGEAPIEMKTVVNVNDTKTFIMNTNSETTIDWGDGNIEIVPVGNNTLTHTYTLNLNTKIKVLDNVVTSLDCKNSNLDSVSIGVNSILTNINCSGNNLTELDVRRAPMLTELNCSNNNINSLDTTQNTLLEKLTCDSNSISKLDLSKNVSITELNCSNNSLSNLDVSKNSALTTLNCDNSTMNPLVMDSAQTVVPVRNVNTKIVRMQQSANGEISFVDGFEFTIIPDEGYDVTALVVGGVNETPAETYTFATLTEDTTITATFGGVYKVTFNPNGGMGEMNYQEFVGGVAKPLSANTFVRAGYKFSGWSKTSNGTVEFADKANYTATSDITLYAVWTSNNYVVTFNANDGLGSMEPQTFENNVPQNLSENLFTKKGFKFIGWATTPTGGVKYVNKESYTAKGNATLYAVWQELPVITVIKHKGAVIQGVYNNHVCSECGKKDHECQCINVIVDADHAIVTQ